MAINKLINPDNHPSFEFDYFGYPNDDAALDAIVETLKREGIYRDNLAYSGINADLQRPDDFEDLGVVWVMSEEEWRVSNSQYLRGAFFFAFYSERFSGIPAIAVYDKERLVPDPTDPARMLPLPGGSVDDACVAVFMIDNMLPR
jgi:hypothetical protein